VARLKGGGDMGTWIDFQRVGGEPWMWWLERHQLKLFLVGSLLAAIF
jgi:hypothetical protein